jgi:ubiquinone/menaquinone biosynthesis C-methylase UbiE
MSMNYDSMAREYARHCRVHPGVLTALLESGRLGAASRVLEAGCGTGNYVITLQETAGCSACGFDPSEQMLAQARERSQRVTFSLGRAEQLAFADGSFDLVFSVDVIHHVVGRQDFFRQAFRILKPGGRVCTVTDSEDIIRNRQPLSNYFPETVEVELKRYPRIADLRAMMEHTGFCQVEEIVTGFTSSITEIQSYRDRAFSSLHLISSEAFDRGIRRMEVDLRAGPIRRISRYLLLWGVRP